MKRHLFRATVRCEIRREGLFGQPHIERFVRAEQRIPPAEKRRFTPFDLLRVIVKHTDGRVTGCYSRNHSSRNCLVSSDTCSERAFNSRVQATSVSIWRGSMLRERQVLIALTT